MDAVYLKNRYNRLFNIRLRKRVQYVTDRRLVFASTADARGFYHSFSPDQKLRLKALCRATSPQAVVASLSPNAVVAALQRGQLQVYLPRGAETAGISGLRAAIRTVLVAIFAHENTETVAFFLVRSEDAGKVGAVHERLHRLIRTQLETSWYKCWEDSCAWHRRLRDSLKAVEYKVLVDALGFDAGRVPIAMIAEAYEVTLLICEHEETRVTLACVVRGHARFQPGLKVTRFTGGALFEIILTAVLVMLTDRAGVAGTATGRQPLLVRSLKQLGGLLQDLAAQLRHGKLLRPGKPKEAVAVAKPSTLADYEIEEMVPEPDEPPGADVDTDTMPPEKGVPNTVRAASGPVETTFIKVDGGTVIAARQGNSLTFVDDLDSFRLSSEVGNTPNRLDIVTHGSPESVLIGGQSVSGNQLADALIQNRQLDGVNQIKLFSCSTGCDIQGIDNVAQTVANRTKLPVSAPNRDLITVPGSDKIFIADDLKFNHELNQWVLVNEGSFIDYLPNN